MSQRQISGSEREESEEIDQTPAYEIASTIGTKDYFLSEQAKNLQNWGEAAKEIFQFTGDVFMNEYEIKASKIFSNYQSDYDDQYSRCRKQFDAYCLLSRKVQKKNDEIENLAQYHANKNTKKNFFSGWKQYASKRKYCRKMQDRAEKYQQQRVMKNVLKEWLAITMESNKVKIKNEVLHRTEIEVSKIQAEYERLIKNLEENLEKKLNELKKQEQQHRLLHDKYEGMYRKSQVQPAE